MELKHRPASFAGAASLATFVNHVLQRGEPYSELGSQHFDHADTARTRRKLTRRIEALGYAVALEPVPEAS